MTNTVPYTKKAFASAILLWMRTDQPRQQGMDYWKGPHSKIISATRGSTSTGSSTSPNQSRALARHPRRRDGHSR